MANVLRGVMCTVRNCSYWEDGNHCSASGIEINVDGGGNRAGYTAETNCNTFKPKV